MRCSLQALPNGEVLLSSGTGGLYRITGLETETFGADFVYNFGSRGSAVPVLLGNFWVQPLGEKRQVVALDISDARHPRPVSSLQFDDRQSPHWLGLEPSSGRIVVANSGPGEYRLWMIRLDRQSGELSFDTSFREPGDDRLGISFDRQQWPHGHSGAAIPHGSVFSNR